MKSYTEIQNTLSTKLFGNSNLAQNIEIQTYSAGTNEYGEESDVFSHQTVVQAIVMDYLQFSRVYDNYGMYKGANFIVLVPDDTVVTEKDLVVFDSQSFDIMSIQKQPFGSGFTHKQLFVKLSP